MDYRLYIADREADLDNDAPILYNYTAEQLDAPAVVRNSYSQQVTLPATPANDDIFGHIWRLDRMTEQQPGEHTGVYFDASLKTDFAIYRNGEVVVSGYLKLESVQTQHGRPTGYTVSLFGGLGSFFYLLSYDASGNKLTLADLDYRRTLDPDGELDFLINKNAVRGAWTYIKTADGTGHDLWDVINFAPCYNGVPDKDFDADKAVLQPASAGLPTSDSGYTTQGGYSLISLPKKYTEWETKDLRSYMQRPVLSIKQFFYALQKLATDNGWTLTLDAGFFNASNKYYEKAWMTLPMLSTLPFDVDTGGWTQELAEDPIPDPTFTQYDAEALITPDQSLPSGTDVICNVTFTPQMDTTAPGTDHYLGLYSPSESKATEQAILYQLVAYDSLNNILGSSEVVAVYSNVQNPRTTSQIMATSTYWDSLLGYQNYTPKGGGQPGAVVEGHFTGAGATQDWSGGEVSLTVQASNVDHYGLRQTPVYFNTDLGFDGFNTVYAPGIQWVTDVYSATREQGVTFRSADPTNDAVTISWSSPATAHTDKQITKALLLSTQNTPADYLLGYTKLFGLRYLTDNISKTVTIMARSDSFTGVIRDLSPRVDLSKAVKVTPVPYTARWYEWQVKHIGEWAKDYSEIYSREYGSQRVNTGYDFDLSTKQVLDKVLYQGCPTAQEKSKYFITCTRSIYDYPAVFIDPGAKQTLYNGAATEQLDIPIITWASTIQSMDAQNVLYDPIPKMQLHGADNKAEDGSGILCFFQGTDTQNFYSKFNLTDDTPIMLQLNSNKPCWVLNPTTEDNQNVGGIYPIFTRDWIDRTYGVLSIYTQSISLSWEMAQPMEMAIPDITADPDGYIYPLYWRSYITDRYDKDCRVVKASALLDGLQVDEALLRDFYWWDNTLWALNKITNYSVTKAAPTEIELIKITNKNNYQ